MPELGPYGSVRGALSNERPYRDSILWIVAYFDRRDLSRGSSIVAGFVREHHARP